MQTFQWAEETKSKLRARHKIAADKEVGLKWRSAEIKADIAADPQAFTARISTAALDRDNEVLLPTGADLREFDKSGAGFFNHDYSRLPVFIPGPVRISGDALIGKGRFLGNQFAQDVREFVTAMAQAGKSAGVSIGFMPMDSRSPSKKDIENYGNDIRVVYTRWKLLEWSIAPVQSNPEAVVVDIGKSLNPLVAKSLYGVEAKPVIEMKRTIYVLMQPEPVQNRIVSPGLSDAVAKAIAKARGRIYE